MSSLFKYFPATYIKGENGKEKNYAIESIENNALWASIPDEFNDLFECDVYFATDDLLRAGVKDNPQVKALYNPVDYAFVDYVRKDVLKKLEEKKKQIGITCFSKNDSEVLMWGHYANSHRGICVEYDEEDIRQCQVKIRYVDYRRNLLMLRDFSKTALKSAADQRLYRKSKQWKYEQEVRAILTNVPQNVKGIPWEAPIPKSIRLGVKVDERLKVEIKDLCKEKGIELYQMQKVPGQYAIEKIKIDL